MVREERKGRRKHEREVDEIKRSKAESPKTRCSRVADGGGEEVEGVMQTP